MITTVFSFFASASAIVRAGATPIFADVDQGTLNLDAAAVMQQLRDHAVRGRLTRKGGPAIRAILPVHLYGQCADMDALMQSPMNLAWRLLKMPRRRWAQSGMDVERDHSALRQHSVFIPPRILAHTEMRES